MQLRKLMAVTFGGIALGLTLAGGFLASHVVTRRAEQQIGQDLTSVAEQLRDGLDRGLFDRLRDVQIAATLDTMRDPGTSLDARRAVLQRLHDTYPSYAIVMFVSPQGQILATSNGLVEGADVSKREYFQEGAKRPFVADVHDAVLLAKLLGSDPNDPIRFVDLAAPIHTDDGRLVGVVVAHLHWSWARELEQTLIGPLRGRQRGLDVFILAQDGTVILGPREYLRQKLPPGLAPAADGQGQVWPDGLSYVSGQQKTQGFKDFEGLGWTVLVRQPSAIALAPAVQLSHEIFGASVIFALVLAGAGWIAASRIARPLGSLATAADRLRIGPEGARLPEMRGYEEVRQLSSSLSALIERLDERRRAEAEALRAKAVADAASQAKSDFLASMSHELRTPLNSIIGFANLLLESRLGPEERRHATTVRDAGGNLLDIVNEILDVSKIEEGRVEFEAVPFSLADLAESTRALFAPTAAAKGLGLHVTIGPQVPGFVIGDPARLRQVLVNLLGNALKFTASGSVALRVLPGSGGETLRFEIEDTGIGIPPEKQVLLFQRFSQVEASTTRRYGGTGLGLAICKGLVEGMGGTIRVDSSAGRGSTFWFELAMPAASPPAPAPEETAGAPSVTVGPMRLLVVDDVSMNRELVISLLAHGGHTIDVAANGAEAVQKAQTGAYDVILMDIQMPVMDGYEATRAIRALPHPSAGTPIIALTANALPEHIARCCEAGMSGHLTKPISRAALLQALKAAASTGSNAGAPAENDEDLARTLLEQMPPHLLYEYASDLDRRLTRLIAEPMAAEAIAADAHRLVASAGQLGFLALSTACGTLEDACRAADEFGMAASLAAVRREAQRMRPALRRLLQDSATPEIMSAASG